MKNLSILKLNNFEAFFWKAKLGFHQKFNLVEYSDESLAATKLKADVVILDFYFSGTSLEEEKEITIEVMSSLKLSGRKVQLFVLSPSFAGEKILNIKKGDLKVSCHNFSITILENICNLLSTNNNFQKAS
jgi:hypothetical protein